MFNSHWWLPLHPFTPPPSELPPPLHSTPPLNSPPPPPPPSELPSSVGDQLGELWSEVAQPHAALRAKMLSALTRPFDEATNNAGPGEGGGGGCRVE